MRRTVDEYHRNFVQRFLDTGDHSRRAAWLVPPADAVRGLRARARNATEQCLAEITRSSIRLRSDSLHWGRNHGRPRTAQRLFEDISERGLPRRPSVALVLSARGRTMDCSPEYHPQGTGGHPRPLLHKPLGGGSPDAGESRAAGYAGGSLRVRYTVRGKHFGEEGARAARGLSPGRVDNLQEY